MSTGNYLFLVCKSFVKHESHIKHTWLYPVVEEIINVGGFKNMHHNFLDYNELETFVRDTGNGVVIIGYQNVPEYEGMVLYLAIHFNTKGDYQLILEWMSLGLDFYGDTLQESYMYKFETLSELIEYVQSSYKISVHDIPHTYHFDIDRFPNSLRDQERKAYFEEGWKKFQHDFHQNKFLDSKLNLVYSSMGTL